MNTALLHYAIIFFSLSLSAFAHNDHIWTSNLLQLLSNNSFDRIGKSIPRIDLLKRHYLSVSIGYPDMNTLRDLKIERNSTISAF